MSQDDRFKEQMDNLGMDFDPEDQSIIERWGEDVQDFYAERGIGSQVGFGQRPALLVIDMAVAFNDPAYKVGADQTPTVEAISELLPIARTARVPIYFMTTAYMPDGRDAGMFGKKVPALLELKVGEPGVEIDPRIAPIDGEHVILKKYASSFFETNLLSLLINDSIDTIVLTGCSTSGCIRACAIDGVSYGFRVIVPEEAVSDRAEGPHYANLFDINAKYGDVLPLSVVLDYLQGLERGQEEVAPSTITTKGDQSDRSRP